MQAGRHRRARLCDAVLLLVAASLAGWPAAATASGTLDPGFSEDGMVFFRFGSGGGEGPSFTAAVARDVAVLGDGSARVFGYVRNQSSEGVKEAGLVAALTSSGSVDEEFADDGWIVLDLRADGTARTTIGAGGRLADGRIVAAGDTSTADGGDGLMAARFTATGEPDREFGDEGVAVVQVDGRLADVPTAALREDGSIVVAGTIEKPPGEHRMVFARLLPDGEPDLEFGDAGTGVVELEPAAAGRGRWVESVAVRPDGSIVFASTERTSGGDELAIAGRLTAGGRLDEDFADGGIQPDAFGLTGTSQGHDAVTLADGGLIVVGEASETSGTRSAVVARLTADGRRDARFGENGRLVLADRGSGMPAFSGAIVQPDGTLLAAGSMRSGFSQGLVARVTPDGALDPSFGDGGIALVPVEGLHAGFNALAASPADRVLAAGAAGGRIGVEMMAARLTAEPPPPAVTIPPTSLHPPIGPAGADRERPRIERLRLSSRVLRLSGARRRGSLTVTYRLSEPAVVRFAVERGVRGTRRGARCARVDRRRPGRPCRRFVRLRGSFGDAGTAGANRLRFRGRIAGRALGPGHHRLVVRARDVAGNRSVPVRARFRVVHVTRDALACRRARAAGCRR